MTTFIHDGTKIPDAPVKDPDSVIDYGCDWSSWLQTSETVSDSTWIVPVGLTASNEVNNGTVTGVTLSGGTEFEEYVVTNRVTTSLERIEDRSMTIRVQNK